MNEKLVLFIEGIQFGFSIIILIILNLQSKKDKCVVEMFATTQTQLKIIYNWMELVDKELEDLRTKNEPPTTNR